MFWQVTYKGKTYMVDAAKFGTYAEARAHVERSSCQEKLDYSLLPARALEAVTAALTFGAAKHADDDFTGNDTGRTPDGEFAAVLRHWQSWRMGKMTDIETGLHHLAHAAARALIALELELRD